MCRCTLNHLYFVPLLVWELDSFAPRTSKNVSRNVYYYPCYQDSINFSKQFHWLTLPLLKQLHWLPVTCRINFKLSTLTYRALSTQQPPYLASLLHISNVPSQLRSSIAQQLIVPKAKLNLGKCAFYAAAHRVWNELPITLKKSSEKTQGIHSKLDFHHKSFVVLIMTFARPCSQLCLMILFCCTSKLRFLRI